MAIGYFVTLGEAESYFTTERAFTEAWDALTDGTGGTKDQRTAILYQAFNVLFYSEEFVLPVYDDATVEELPTLRRAQAEMAYYLAQHGADQDVRQGLKAQGVIEAGAVKEKFDKDHLDREAIPQNVRNILIGYWAGTDQAIFPTDIDREENYHAATDVVEDVIDDLED